MKLKKSGISGKPPAIDAEHDCSVNKDALELPMDLTGPIENSAPGSPSRKKQKEFDVERVIIMGHELTDIEINLAQEFLRLSSAN